MKANAQKMFGLLYLRLVLFIDKKISDPDEAVAIANNVFAQHFAELGRYDSTGDCRPLIRALEAGAGKECYRFLSKRVPRSAGYEDSVEKPFTDRDFLSKLIKAARLTGRQESVVDLRLRGYTAEEAALMMKVCESTNRSVLHKAIKKIQKTIKSGRFK